MASYALTLDKTEGRGVSSCVSPDGNSNTAVVSANDTLRSVREEEGDWRKPLRNGLATAEDGGGEGREASFSMEATEPLRTLSLRPLIRAPLGVSVSDKTS